MPQHDHNHQDLCAACRARKAVMELFPKMMQDGEDPGHWLTGAAEALGVLAGMYCTEPGEFTKFLKIAADGYVDGSIARSRVEMQKVAFQ